MNAPNPNSKFDRLTEREKDEICELYRSNIKMNRGGMETTARMFCQKRGWKTTQECIQGSVVKRVLEERHEKLRTPTNRMKEVGL